MAAQQQPLQPAATAEPAEPAEVSRLRDATIQQKIGMEILGVNHQKVYMFQASVKRKTALQKLHFCMGFVKDDGKLWEPRIVSFYCQAVIW